MSIRPISFDESTQTYTMLHDDPGYMHEFELPLSEIAFFIDPKNNEVMWDKIVLQCKIDNSDSTHPISGGSAPPEIQELSANVVATKGCPCGTVNVGEPYAVCLAHSKLHTSQLEGPERWQVPLNSGQIESILVNDTSTYIVGVGPFDTIPSGYSERSLLARSAGAEDLEKVLNNIYTKYSGNHQIVVSEKPDAASSD